jgi:anti-sigma regulatory factor (Ser/Thr protein kinase)
VQQTFDRSLAAISDLLDFVDEFAGRQNLGGKMTFATRLVVEELFANFVRHNVGGGDHIDVSLDVETGVLTLKLWDFGVKPFDISNRGPVDVARPLGERTAGGLGLHFVRSFFDDLTYEHSNGTMCVTATKRIGRTDV